MVTDQSHAWFSTPPLSSNPVVKRGNSDIRNYFSDVPDPSKKSAGPEQGVGPEEAPGS